MGRDVALKVIHGNMTNLPNAVQHFQREACLIARLEHLHFLPVQDFDGSHDPPYIVMRFFEGGTLKEVLAQSLLPLHEVAFFLGIPRLATVIADESSIVYRLTRAAMETMQAEDPSLALAFKDLMLRFASERLVAANREISALNR